MYTFDRFHAFYLYICTKSVKQWIAIKTIIDNEESNLYDACGRDVVGRM